MNLKRFIPQSSHASKCIPFLRLCSLVQCKAPLKSTKVAWSETFGCDEVIAGLCLFTTEIDFTSHCNISVHFTSIGCNRVRGPAHRTVCLPSIFQWINQPTNRITNKPTQSILNLKCHRVLAATNVNHEYKIHV